MHGAISLPLAVMAEISFIRQVLLERECMQFKQATAPAAGNLLSSSPPFRNGVVRLSRSFWHL